MICDWEVTDGGREDNKDKNVEVVSTRPSTTRMVCYGRFL